VILLVFGLLIAFGALMLRLSEVHHFRGCPPSPTALLLLALVDSAR
jgi:hypothetical protein